MTDLVTRVEICLYKPTGFQDTYWIRTQDRWAAIMQVSRLYDPKTLTYVNGVTARLEREPPPDSKESKWVLDYEKEP